MIKVLEVRSFIYAHFQECDDVLNHFLKPEHCNSYAAYYTSIYLIQDTAEAISTHMEIGFSKKPNACVSRILGRYAGCRDAAGRDL
jgi:hypothetical protein